MPKYVILPKDEAIPEVKEFADDAEMRIYLSREYEEWLPNEIEVYVLSRKVQPV